MIEAVEKAIGRSVSRETYAKLESYVDLLKSESENQNLIAAGTIDSLWNRHIMDSAQLCPLIQRSENLLDIGSGAGLPGIVIAILTSAPITLVEPRKLRAAFLGRVVAELELLVEVRCAKVEHLSGTFDVITARAVAKLSKLLTISQHLTHRGTRWVLPKGRSWKSELAEAELKWHYDVQAVPSMTDPDAEILVLSNVRAKSSR
jgi:16S rRNA (guanine527-N7)-methyltransferase